MNNDRFFKIFVDCIKKTYISALLLVITFLINIIVSSLYNVATEPIKYTCILSLFAYTVYFLITLAKESEKAKTRKRYLDVALTEKPYFNPPKTLEEKDYQSVIKELSYKLEKVMTASQKERNDMLDYYTVWVHQIKTPIAVMRMELSGVDTKENRALIDELFRIEQYAQMALQYIRLNSEINDLVVNEYSLDELIRQSIRKYASQFISRKLTINYEGTNEKIITDKKWFSCILDQLLSNAVKYTPSGGVSVDVVGNKLIIEDTGIGISPEDLPRIFEMGYTGINGRNEQKSSGLGLYICKKAADKLAVKITAESEPKKGTKFIIEYKK